MPEGQSRVAGSAIRLGEDGAAAVQASRSDKTYITKAQVGEPISELAIGHTLPAGFEVAKAELDGEPVTPETRTTNRGLDVTVDTTAGTHTLTVTAA